MVVVATTLVREARSNNVDGSDRRRVRLVGESAEGFDDDQASIVRHGDRGSGEGLLGDGLLQDGEGSGEGLVLILEGLQRR